MSQITVFPSHGDNGDTIVGRSRDTIMLTKIAKTVLGMMFPATSSIVVSTPLRSPSIVEWSSCSSFHARTESTIDSPTKTPTPKMISPGSINSVIGGPPETETRI